MPPPTIGLLAGEMNMKSLGASSIPSDDKRGIRNQDYACRLAQGIAGNDILEYARIPSPRSMDIHTFVYGCRSRLRKYRRHNPYSACRHT